MTASARSWWQLYASAVMFPRYSKPRRTLPPSLKLGQDIIARQVGRHNRHPARPAADRTVYQALQETPIFGQVAQAASLESSPPRSTASKRSKRVLLVSLATKKHHQERAFILTLHLVYIRTCIEPCTTKMTTPSAASAIDKCFGYIESTTQE
jgi:hypothetical protein